MEGKNCRRNRKLVLSLVIVFCLVSIPQTVRGQNEDLDVFWRWMDWSHRRELLQRHLNSLAFEQLRARQTEIDGLKTAADWKQRQIKVKAALDRVVGPFPERTALNARVTHTVLKKGFRVEHVVFESIANFFVTGSLFVPDGLRGKAPAILNVIGHTDISYRAPGYQQLILNLVKKGFIVFAIDPIGQGERLQYYDPDLRRSLVGGSTSEHSHLGNQCFLAGSSAAMYFTWDGIRAIDYLVSRAEVDPERIGVTGLSGGGTQTSYISAFDDRVLAAAPANYICGFHRLFQSIGPQDAEQNFNSGVANGIDHADFLEIRAPKPTLVIATTRDFFSIEGTRETVGGARKAFQALGAGDNLLLVEDDHGHGYTRNTREATYAFFQKHLDNPGSATEEEVEFLSVEELTVTPTGQLIDSLGGETVYSINKKLVQRLVQDLERNRKNLSGHLQEVAVKARQLSGYLEPAPLSGVVFRGRHQRPGYSIEQYFIAGEGKLVLPLLLFKPQGVPKSEVILYLHAGGKAAEAGMGGEIDWFVTQGYTVVAPDLSGMGEMGTVGNSVAYLGVQTGRSIVGIRAADIIRVIQFLKERQGVALDGVWAVARGGVGSTLLHAAMVEPAIEKVALLEPFVSFRAIAVNRFYQVSVADMVFNALTAYDLPDLKAALAPRPLLIVNPRDQLLQPANQDLIEKDLGVVQDAYASKNAGSDVTIQQGKRPEQVRELLVAWLQK